MTLVVMGFKLNPDAEKVFPSFGAPPWKASSLEIDEREQATHLARWSR